jgi:hypothetical protein
MELSMPQTSGLAALHKATQRDMEDRHPDEDYDPRDPDAGPPPQPRVREAQSVPAKPQPPEKVLASASAQPIKANSARSKSVPAADARRPSAPAGKAPDRNPTGDRFQTSIYFY